MYSTMHDGWKDRIISRTPADRQPNEVIIAEIWYNSRKTITFQKTKEPEKQTNLACKKTVRDLRG